MLLHSVCFIFINYELKESMYLLTSLNHQKMRRIYIFGGHRQRWAQKCPEFLWYDIETGLTQSVPMPSTVDKPPMGYTQRATIDIDHDEIYVLSVST